MDLTKVSLATVLVALSMAVTAQAAVQVVVGATPIQNGEATAAGDITLINEKLAFALAVQSAVPYGVPRGAIVDVAPVTAGKIGRDQMVFADFIPNAWSAWPNTYQHVDIVERGAAQATVRAVRDWGKVTITTLYTLKANSDHVEIQTTMRNDGDVALPDLRSGLTLWQKGGFFFRVPGLAQMERGKADGALTDRVVAYDENWSVALHAPYFDQIGEGSRDLYRLHTLAPGESRRFDGWLQVGGSGSLGAVIQAEIERGHLRSGVVRGVVTSRDGLKLAQPVVVIEKQGQPYGWVVGRNGAYDVTLPQGDYALYATGRNYSQSPPVKLSVGAGSSAVRDFRDLEKPGQIQFRVTDTRSGKPLDARIAIVKGQKPLVEFLGKKTFFTELDAKGHVDVPIAAGSYEFSVSSSGGFLNPPNRVTVSVVAGKAQAVTVAVTPRFDPPARGWYSADLHHHADQAEAVTPPADMARSQLAAGLDLLFVSDHDSTVNHQALQRIAAKRAMAFIAGIEISPSWGHFNAYPLLPGAKLAIDTSTASVEDVLREGRRMGAIVMQSNHPFIPYGYFTSFKAGVAPGGFNPGFDLVEINAGYPGDDAKVLRQLWDFWNAGHRFYLTAGTDTHDVWNSESGLVRVFAHLDGKPSAQGFAQAMKDGHAYVSFGPLIFPSVMFGDTLRLKPGAPFTLGFDLKSVAGVAKVELIAGGAIIKTETFAGETSQETRVDFPLTANSARWYSLLVEDKHGKKAYTNPIWIDTVDDPITSAVRHQ